MNNFGSFKKTFEISNSFSKFLLSKTVINRAPTFFCHMINGMAPKCKILNNIM